MKPSSYSFVAAGLIVAGATLAARAATPLSDRDFVFQMSRANQTEIAAAQAILKTTTDTRVRQYATTMIADHSTANVELRVAARKAGLQVPAFRTVTVGGVQGAESPPPARSSVAGAPVGSGETARSGPATSQGAAPSNATAVVASASAPPPTSPQSYTAGDLAYLKDQVAAHQQTLALAQAEAKSGQSADLKAYADEQTTVISHHLDVASADLNNGASPPPAGPTTAPSSAASPFTSSTEGPASQASHAP